MATKKINEKTSGITMAGFQARTPVAPPPTLAAPVASPSPSKSFTGAGIFMAAITGKDDVSKELAEVQRKLDEATGKLDQFEGSVLAQQLDAAMVKPSKWANRNVAAFTGQVWEEFKEEIKSAGGNIQPIKVRGVRQADTLSQTSDNGGVRLADTLPLSYEIVFGHRRHRACLELELPVLALVEDISDRDLFEQMDRENRQRADLTIYEQGEMYRHALDSGLYPSIRNLVELIGVGLSSAADAVQIARLPATVLDAFESRLDIQRRWAAPLTNALKTDPDITLAVAKEIAVERGQGTKVKSTEVFKRLTSRGIAAAAPVTRPVKLAGGAVMQVTTNGDKLKFEFDSLTPAHAKLVEKAILAALG
jgi:ParB family chromosome partitioning protein